MPHGCCIRTALLCAAVALALAAPAGAKKFPSADNKDYSSRSICELNYADKRVPVYRTPSTSEAPIFYLPRNYGACVSGAIDGWGLFGLIREAAFFRPLSEMIPDQNADYGWIRLTALKPGGADEICHLRRDRAHGPAGSFEFPGKTGDDRFDICPTSFDAVSNSDAVVLFQQRLFQGETYSTLAPSSLNRCTKTCRDDPKCKGFSYAIPASRCDLKSGGAIDFDSPGNWQDILSGVKLID